MSEPRRYWIYKGTSNFCSELIMSDDCDTMVKQNPDGFYDIISLADTIEGGIPVIELSTYQALEEKLRIAIEFVESCITDDGNGCYEHMGDLTWSANRALQKLKDGGKNGK